MFHVYVQYDEAFPDDAKKFWSSYFDFDLHICNFNLDHNIWTIRDRYFIFGMHFQLMTLSQMTPESMTLWPLY